MVETPSSARQISYQAIEPSRFFVGGKTRKLKNSTIATCTPRRTCVVIVATAA